MLRYTDRVLRELGQRLHLQDVLEHSTLADHAALLVSRGNRQATLLVDTAFKQPLVQETQALFYPVPVQATESAIDKPSGLNSNPLDAALVGGLTTVGHACVWTYGGVAATHAAH